MGHLSIVSLLTNYSWPPVGCQLDATAQEALIISAKEGHIDIMECLLNNELVKINDECPLSGDTSLCAAASSGRKDSCKVLLKRGADSSKENRNGDLPLHLATTNGHYEIVDLLMNNGVPVDQADKQGRSPLLVAANVGQVGVIELLLTRGANKSFKDSKVTFKLI
jgi:ankyrin repeat protein